MMLLKITTVNLKDEVPPRVEKRGVTVQEWNNYMQSQLRMGAKRSKAGKVLTLVTDSLVIVTQVVM